MSVPLFEDLMIPTFNALKDLGGEGDIWQIQNKVIQLLKLSDEDAADIHRGKRTKLGYRMAWSRNYLKRAGLLEKVGRAYWALTDIGHKTAEIDKDKIVTKVKALDKNLNAEVELDLDDDNLIVDNARVEQEDTGSSEITNPFDPKKIDITSKPMILDVIFKRIVQDEIDLLTDFQRQGDLWDWTKQSRLIESVLIRFPLPAFYFDGTNEDKWGIVDGLQRISTFKNFVIDKTLKLQNLEFLTQFNNCGYDDLPRNLKRRLEEAEITVYIINPGTPDEVKYNVFKRINTTALILEPQEIRHAINQGIPSLFVKELADLEVFKIATSYAIKTHRMLDRDFVTRFLSFYLNHYKDYQPDLDSFMNKSMASLKTISVQERQDIKTRFSEAMDASYKIFADDAFRKRFDKDDYRKPINKALFEVWSVTLAKLNPAERKLLVSRKGMVKEEFMNLLNDDNSFSDSLSSGTSDKNRVIKRFTAINDLVNKVIAHD